MAMTKPMYTET